MTKRRTLAERAYRASRASTIPLRLPKGEDACIENGYYRGFLAGYRAARRERKR